ncbi:MAG: hypothetical protein IKP24_00525, partial [Alphaproteobacteria bacterium]|nr:hypothetical protein [Alphaproteobacteria bacterium]
LYNSAKFQNVIDALDTAVSTINNIVAGTIAQANSISELASGKQTRPNPADSSDETCPTSCPNYRQCLLVEKDDGTPCWYPINDPWYDFTKPILATQTNGDTSANNSGYTQLEYIESTGTQYIDTGIVPNQDSRMTIDVLAPALGAGVFSFGGSFNQAWRPGFGVYGGNTTYRASLVYNNLDTQLVPETTLRANVRYVFDLNKNVSTLQANGSTIASITVDAATFSLTNSIELFRVNIASAPRYGNFRLYSAKIYNNNTLVRNMIPVRRNSDFKYGMYDTVNGVFYGNAAASGDDFTPGPIVENDPGVPGMVWSVTWNANQNGVIAGAVDGVAKCNASTSSSAVPGTDAGWNTVGYGCWCKIDGINVDNKNISAPSNVRWWFISSEAGSASRCASNCAYDCAYYIRTTHSTRQRFFGEPDN